MNKLILAFLIVAFLLVLPVQATIYVGGEDGFPSISEAILEAKENETIIVYEGIYKENIEVDKSVSIRSYGKASDTVIGAKYSWKNIANIRANKVTISGFTIRNSVGDGIYLDTVEGCNISANNIYSTRFGIRLFSSSNNIITHNTANLNNNDGIFLESSNDNRIVNNTANSNKQYHGIELSTSNNNAIIGNNASNNFDSGIALFESSNNNTIKGNTANSNKQYHGILLSTSNNNSIIANNASNNFDSGIAVFESSNNNTITGNIANLNNNDGIYLESSHNNSIWNNTANSNKRYHGIALHSSNKNAILSNNVSNNFDSGIALLESSNNNRIKNNTVSENGVLGIGLEDWSSGNEVSNNIVNKNLGGILLSRSDTNIIKDNTCENSALGIWLQDWSSGNEVSNNIVNKNSMGINVQFESNNNVIKDNTACENEVEGIKLVDSSNNEVSNNIANKNLGGIIVLDKLAANNVIKDNTACENGDVGIQLQETSMNEVCNNVANKNYKGIALIRSNDNIIKNNIANENKRVGIKIEDSSKNKVSNNIVNKGVEYICLARSNFTKIQNNNVGKSKISISMPILESFFNHFDHNYWSDYTGEDKDKDGIGDEPYEIGGAYKDYHPYMNYSGWLNVVVTPEFWYFFAKKGDVIYKNFRIENRLNRPTNVEVLLDKNLDFEADHYVTEISKKTFSLAPKSIQIVTLQLNTTNLEDYILRKITFKTEEYTKTTLVNGFVQPKSNEVKIEGVDFHRNVVQGQINPFNVMLRNHGDRGVFNVTLTMGRNEKSKRVFLSDNKSETKTVPFEIDTSDMPLGITRGQVVVLKSNKLSDRPLDYLNLTMFVASELEASTLIVTNHKRMRENWGNDSVNALEDKVLALCFHPAVNGIILDVASNTNISILFDEWDNAKTSEKANEIAKAIKSLIETKCKLYQNIEYLVIVGDDRIIPFYRILDNTSEPFIAGWDTERNYHDLNVNSTVGSALHRNMFLTDNIYAANRPIEWETAEVSIPELYIPIMPLGRLVESPEDISAVIDAFFQQEYVNPNKIFVSGSDFMKDSAALCGRTLEKKTKGDVTVVVNETVDSFQQIKYAFLNISSSNNIVFVFQHAEHDRFLIHYGNITSQDVSQSLLDLNNTIICSLGCHSGLNVPPNASIDDLDLVQAFAQKGVLAYIAPTGYSIGLRRIIGAHELLISYLTKHLCEGRDVGTALMQAKQEYWATNYDFIYIDEKVFESTTLYGLPMVPINIPQSKVKIKSMEVDIHKEQPDTLVIRPLHTQNSTPDGNYYMTPSRELLSDPGKPVQPKEIRIFYPTSASVLRGAVMNSSKYHQNKSFTPLIDAYMQSHEIPEFKSYRIENWYPAQIFKINSISYPKDPMQSRQYLIIITGQYKGRTLPGMPGEERLYKELSFDLYYATPDEETKPPVIRNVSPTRINDTINITVNVMDKSGIQKVLVTYTDINGDWGEWRSKACKLEEGDLWSCNISAKEEIEFFVQAVDNAGNAAVVEQWRI